jgi:ceramide glucosyltransferase
MLQLFFTPYLVKTPELSRNRHRSLVDGPIPERETATAMTLTELASGFGALAIFVQLASVSMAAWRCRRRSRRALALPAVTLLRPVCGHENFLEETLGSSFRLDCPNYEILFCAARQDDPAVPIVRRLIAENPSVPARLLVGDDGISANPKLGNLVKGWDAARHDWIIMADSNVLMPHDFVQRLLAAWRSDTGLVCSMPIGARAENFWAELECAFLNTLQARFQYVSEALGWGFAQGKAMLFQRDIVDRAGGIRALAAETAEDAATTKLVRAAGLKVCLVDMAFEQPLGRRGAREVWARQVRWARLRRVSFPLLFLPELLVGSALPTAALAIGLWAQGPAAVASGMILLPVLWIASEAMLARAAGWQFTVRTVLAVLLRDLLLPALWIAGWLGNDYVWRGNRIIASPGNAERFGHIRWLDFSRTYVEIKRRFWQGV